MFPIVSEYNTAPDGFQFGTGRSENVWGYTKIIGEIKKMGLRPPSKNTVKRILKEHGYDPMPKRGDGSWDEFLKRHAASLWQCDFLGKRLVTLCGGVRTAFVLVFINLKTRQVIVSPSTLNPNDEWVCAQTERFVHLARGRGLPVEYLQHNSDTKGTRKASYRPTNHGLVVRVPAGVLSFVFHTRMVPV